MARAAVTTTLAAASGATTGLMIKRGLPNMLGGAHVWDLGHTCNSLLGALVSITAGCSVTDPYAAIIIGFLGAWVYHGASCLMRKLKVCLIYFKLECSVLMTSSISNGFLGAWVYHGASCLMRSVYLIF